VFRCWGGKSLLEYTIKAAQQSKYINEIIVTTDSVQTSKLANRLGAKTPFIRDDSFSKERVGLEKVYQYSMKELEKQKMSFDVVVLLEITFPFRPKNLIDELIEQLVSQGVDSVIPVRKEFNSCWIKEKNQIIRIDDGFTPRKFKDPVYIGCKGLGCATYPLFLKKGKIFGEAVEIYDIEDKRYFFEVRDAHDFQTAEKLLKAFNGKEFVSNEKKK